MGKPAGGNVHTSGKREWWPRGRAIRRFEGKTRSRRVYTRRGEAGGGFLGHLLESGVEVEASRGQGAAGRCADRRRPGISTYRSHGHALRGRRGGRNADVEKGGKNVMAEACSGEG